MCLHVLNDRDETVAFKRMFRTELHFFEKNLTGMIMKHADASRL